jgi:protein subunit release factor B
MLKQFDETEKNKKRGLKKDFAWGRQTAIIKKKLAKRKVWQTNLATSKPRFFLLEARTDCRGC